MNRVYPGLPMYQLFPSGWCQFPMQVAPYNSETVDADEADTSEVRSGADDVATTSEATVPASPLSMEARSFLRSQLKEDLTARTKQKVDDAWQSLE